MPSCTPRSTPLGGECRARGIIMVLGVAPATVTAPAAATVTAPAAATVTEANPRGPLRGEHRHCTQALTMRGYPGCCRWGGASHASCHGRIPPLSTRPLSHSFPPPSHPHPLSPPQGFPQREALPRGNANGSFLRCRGSFRAQCSASDPTSDPTVAEPVPVTLTDTVTTAQGPDQTPTVTPTATPIVTAAQGPEPRLPSPVLGLLGAALSVGAGAAVSKVLGLGREAALAAAFGVGPVMTAYTYSSLLPSFFLSLLGGVNGPFHSAVAAALSRGGAPTTTSPTTPMSYSLTNPSTTPQTTPTNSSSSTPGSDQAGQKAGPQGIDQAAQAAQEASTPVRDQAAQEEDDGRLIAAIAWISVGAALLLSALIFLHAPSVISALAPGLKPTSSSLSLSAASSAPGAAELAAELAGRAAAELAGGGVELALAVGQLRLMLPCLVVSPLLGILFGVLSAKRQYFLPSLAPSVSSATLLLSLLVYSITLPLVQQQYRLAYGASTVAAGTTLGALGQLALVLYALRKRKTSPGQGSSKKKNPPSGRQSGSSSHQLGLLTKGPLTQKSIRDTFSPLPTLSALQLTLTQAAAAVSANLGSIRGALGALVVSLQHSFTVLFEPRVVQVLSVLLPAIVSSGLLQIATFTDLYFASFQPGAAAALGYANLLAMAPIGILSTSLLVPALPMFSQISAPENWPELRIKIRDSVLLCLAVALPLVSVGAPLARPLVACAFQRKSFGAPAARLVASLFAAYACGAPAYVVRDVLVRVFYGLGDGATPFYVSLLAIGANAALDPLLFGLLRLGAPGLVWATVAVNTLSAAALLVSLQRKLGGLGFREQEWGRPLAGLAAAAAASALACRWLLGLAATQSQHGVLGTGVAGVGGCVVYAAVCLVLGLDQGVVGQALRSPRLKAMLHMTA